MKLDPYLTALTKINFKWIKDLKMRPETTKFLEKSIGEKLLDIYLRQQFPRYDTKSRSNKSKNK